MIVQCEYCRRSYESDTADENCPHSERLALNYDTFKTANAPVQHVPEPPETAPAFGGPANNHQLPIIGDTGSTLDITIQAQPALPHSPPVEISHEQYELHETPAGQRFYRHIKQDDDDHPQPHGKRWAGIRVLTDTRAPEHHIFGAANQQRAREAKRRLG
jgi:hypothetical protein